MQKQQLTVRQATLWLILFQIGSAFLLLPSILTLTAKQDSWIAVIVALGLFLPCILIYTAIAKQMQQRSLGQYLNETFGKWIGSILLCVFVLCVPFFLFIATLRTLSDFIMSAVMARTPVDIIYVLMLFVVYFAVRAGITVIGRAVELLFFVIPVLFIINSLSLLPSMHLDYMMPTLEYGIKPVIKAAFPLLGFPYLECVVFLYLVTNMNQPQKWRKAVIRGTLFSGLMYLVMMIIIVAVLSEGVTSNLTYASYYVIRTISISNFIERFEIAVTVFWYISIFFRLSLLLYVTAHGFAEVFRIQNANSLLLPLLLIAYTLTYSIWPNQSFVMEFIQVYPWYAITYGIIGPVLLWIIGKWRNPA